MPAGFSRCQPMLSWRASWCCSQSDLEDDVSGGHPEPVVAPPRVTGHRRGGGIWLLLRAFAAGCTAMTGVEAVSNGVGAFREPVVENAARLRSVSSARSLRFSSPAIAYLVGAYGILAMDQTQEGYQSVLSQLAGAVVGRGWFYSIAIGSLLTVLCLSAEYQLYGVPPPLPPCCE